MAKVTIADLRVCALVGTRPEERIRRQQLVLEVGFTFDASAAAERDDLTASVDYAAVEKLIVTTAEESDCRLLEALARRIALAVLDFSAAVSRVEVAVTKPAASAFGAEITYQEEFVRRDG